MKVRLGFVSNSSSSSFCVYGVSVDREFIDQGHEDDDDYFYEYSSKANDAGLEAEYYEDTCYLGLSWSSIGDNETGLQFKQRVEELVRKFVGEGIELEFGTIDEVIEC